MHPHSPVCWICNLRTVDADRAGPLPFVQICSGCEATTQGYDESWRLLSRYLRDNWRDITTRGSFDLSKAFAVATVGAAVNVQLFFVKVLGSKLAADRIAVDLAPFASALLTAKPHPDVSLLVADAGVPQGKLYSYDSDVSVLRADEEVQSALWMYLLRPVAIKICYLKAGAPVRVPTDSHPWHPTRQRKIVKLSPYKGDTQPLVARRDLRI
jgi:hypothetical protein